MEILRLCSKPKDTGFYKKKWLRLLCSRVGRGGARFFTLGGVCKVQPLLPYKRFLSSSWRQAREDSSRAWGFLPFLRVRHKSDGYRSFPANDSMTRAELRGERKIDSAEHIKKLDGVPVLFIPENGGSYKQEEPSPALLTSLSLGVETEQQSTETPPRLLVLLGASNKSGSFTSFLYSRDSEQKPLLFTRESSPATNPAPLLVMRSKAQ